MHYEIWPDKRWSGLKKKDDDRCKVMTIAKITLYTMCALFVVGVSDCCLTPTQHLFQLYHFQ